MNVCVAGQHVNVTKAKTLKHDTMVKCDMSKHPLSHTQHTFIFIVGCAIQTSRSIHKLNSITGFLFSKHFIVYLKQN